MQQELDRQKRAAVELAGMIRAQLGDDDSTSTVVEDMVGGETDLFEIVDRIITESLEIDALAEGLKSYKAAIDARKSRYEAKSEKLRASVASVLSELGIKGPIRRPSFTLSVGVSPQSVQITDEDSLPFMFKKVKSEPDKKAIKAALETGQAVDGAHLSNGGPRLIVRV